jgi:hypothetical protein
VRSSRCETLAFHRESDKFLLRKSIIEYAIGGDDCAA